MDPYTFQVYGYFLGMMATGSIIGITWALLHSWMKW